MSFCQVIDAGFRGKVWPLVYVGILIANDNWWFFNKLMFSFSDLGHQ